MRPACSFLDLQSSLKKSETFATTSIFSSVVFPDYASMRIMLRNSTEAYMIALIAESSTLPNQCMVSYEVNE